MIDYFALALTHGLLAIALLRLAKRSDLDAEGAVEIPPEPDADAAESRREARARRRRRA